MVFLNKVHDNVIHGNENVTVEMDLEEFKFYDKDTLKNLVYKYDVVKIHNNEDVNTRNLPIKPTLNLGFSDTVFLF